MDSKSLRSLLLAVPCILLALFYSYRGILLDTDSKTYLFAAEYFAAHGSLAMPDGSPWVVFPPLFPLILGAFKIFFGTVLLPCMIANVLFLFLGLWFVIRTMEYVLQGKNTTVCFVMFSLSATLFLVYVYLYSESLFFPLLMAYVYLKIIHKQDRFWQKAVLLSLMYLVRYTGLLFVISFLAWDLYQHRRNLTMFFKLSLKEYLMPLVVIGIWMAYCYAKVGNVIGEAYESRSIAIVPLLATEFEIVSDWFLPYYIGIALWIYLLIGYISKPQVNRYSNQLLFQTAFFMLLMFLIGLVPRTSIEERTLFPVYFFSIAFLGTMLPYHPLGWRYIIWSVILIYSGIRFIKNYLFWLS